MAEIAREARKGPRVEVQPYPIKRALPFVRTVHRRLPKVQGGMWSVAAWSERKLVGVAVVGHPQARLAQDEWGGPEGVSLEVLRVAVFPEARNACSALYGACSRAARHMGAVDLWTSIHSDEGGGSLRAAGWVELGPCGGGEWDRPSRHRAPVVDLFPKTKWAVPWGRRARRRALAWLVLFAALPPSHAFALARRRAAS